MNARDVMTLSPVTIRPTAKLREAVELLYTLDVRHLPVVDEDGVLIGMLSDRDLRGLMYPEVFGGEYAGEVLRGLDVTVSSMMSSDVLSVDTESDIAEVVELMLEHRVGAIPVVDPTGTGELIGIISYMDILRQVAPEEAAQ